MNTHYFKMAFQMLRSNPFFAVLSIAAISITVMIVLILSMQYEMVIAPRTPEVNLDRVVVMRKAIFRNTETGSLWSSSLGGDLVDHLRAELKVPEAISQISYSRWNFVSANGVLECALIYTDANYWNINSFIFVSGRSFLPEEVEQKAEVIVITQSIAEKQFGDQEPVGRIIEIIGKPFQIIGVVEDISTTRRYAYGDMWIPYTQNASDNFHKFLGSYKLLLMAESPKDIIAMKQEVQTTIQNLAHTLEENETLTVTGPDTAFEDYFRGWNDSEEVGIVSSWMQIILRILAIIAVPALNLIAINLTWIGERNKEIGLRKAFGATNATVIKQLLAENTIITFIGGTIGLAMTIAVVNSFSLLLFRGTWGEQANFADVSVTVLPFLVTMGAVFILSLFSGLLPAIRISRTEPALVLKGGAL